MSVPARLYRAAAEPSRSPLGPLVGQHPRIVRLIDAIQRAAALDTPVLIEGPTGAGKELVAERLHAYSGRPGRLVALNVANLSETLAESELFGSARGAFTDAHRERSGLIEGASGGTLYLDEAAELSSALQAKMLRVLETGMVRKVGGTEDRHVCFRLILSSQRPAGQLVSAGKWRADFYYRVAGVTLDVPALSDRASDIPLLVNHFMGLLGRPALDPGASSILADYSWPGNVRELRRAVERAVFAAGDRAVTPEDLQEAIGGLRLPSDVSQRRPRRQSLKDMERDHILAVLKDTAGDTKAAASILGLSRSQVYRRLQQLGISLLNKG